MQGSQLFCCFCIQKRWFWYRDIEHVAAVHVVKMKPANLSMSCTYHNLHIDFSAQPHFCFINFTNTIVPATAHHHTSTLMHYTEGYHSYGQMQLKTQRWRQPRQN
ncbi:hypothetical protein GOODEAATRI_022213 [Goodea atripinnis]|uniref:Uncharacterized protein n=1 Tax=Goodea atripinnis TaxID=208336 RepID=A0ABV0PGD4_9TELE